MIFILKDPAVRNRLEADQIKRVLKENDIVLLLLPHNRYSDKIIEIAKIISLLNKKVCYVCLNKPHTTLQKDFEKNKIDVDKFFFVDCVTKNANDKRDEYAVYVSSPKALTEISIVVKKVLETSKIESTVFDSLSTLLIYEDAHVVLRFTHSIVSVFRNLGSKGILIALKEDMKSELGKDLNMFVDKVLDSFKKKIDTIEEKRKSEINKKFSDITKSLDSQLQMTRSDIDGKLEEMQDRFDKEKIKREKEIEDVIRQFISARTGVEEKLKEVNSKIKELSKIRSSLKSEILKESLSGVDTEVKKVVDVLEDKLENFEEVVKKRIEDIEEKVDRNSESVTNDMDGKISSLREDIEKRMRDVTDYVSKNEIKFSESISSINKILEKLDIKKTKELEKNLELLSKNLDERFKTFSSSVDDKIAQLEKQISQIESSTDEFHEKIKEEMLEEIEDEVNKVKKSISDTHKDILSLKNEIERNKQKMEKSVDETKQKLDTWSEKRKK